ncbi:MAG TPA: APC family permease [archaeon]|nr:APC family permease [archaeon]
MQHLKKELGLMELTLYGVGVILGAGIYALIGVGAGIAGNAVWLSFTIAAFIAALTGLSYAELSSMYPKSAAEYNYSKHAFNNKTLSFGIGFLMIVASTVAAVTVALGFAGYFTHSFGGSVQWVAAALLLALSVLNYRGIKESSQFNMLSTLIETAGLLVVVFVGVLAFNGSGVRFDLLETPDGAGLPGILAATAIIFFAYLGFEDVVNVSEETRNARKVVPKALVISIVVSTALYILVALSAVNVLGWERLAESKAPLTEVVSAVIPNTDFVFSLIALFATANTSLVLLIVASRVIYGMSKDNALPGIFSRIGSRGTPGHSVLLVALASVLLALSFDIKTVAGITDFSLFLVYASVNASLIMLRYSQPSAPRAFRTPLNAGKFPLLAFFGLVSSLFMLQYFEVFVVVMSLAVIAFGLALHYLLEKSREAVNGLR